MRKSKKNISGNSSFSNLSIITNIFLLSSIIIYSFTIYKELNFNEIQLILMTLVPLFISIVTTYVINALKDFFSKSYIKDYRFYKKVLLVGATPEAEYLIKETLRLSENSIRYIGILDDKVENTFSGIPVIGKFENLLDVITVNSVDEIIFTTTEYIDGTRELAKKASRLKVTVKTIAKNFGKRLSPVYFESDGIVPLITYADYDNDWELSKTKRFIDIIISSFAIAVTLPLSLLLIVVLILSGQKYILTRDERVGLMGRRFYYYKFNCFKKHFIKNGEEKLHENIFHQMKQENRLTNIGAFLKTYNFDAIPQFWNVLKGDMSLIGPRPLPPDLVFHNEPQHRKRVTVRPGIFGPSQIRGKTLIPTESALKWDVWYVKNSSLQLDIKLIIQSFWIILRGLKPNNIIKLPVLDVNISVGKYREFIRKFDKISSTDKSEFVCFVNVHMLVEAKNSVDFRNMINSSKMNCPDGMPVARSISWFYGLRQQKVSGPDTIIDLMNIAHRSGKKIFILGGLEDVLEKFVKRAKKEYSQELIAGYYSPPFRELTVEEDEEVVKMINASGASMTFVALGCPKQEKWMFEHKGRVKGCMYGLGFAIPAYAKAEKRAPVILQKLGLEWFHRLMSNPRRLFRRYFITNSIFISHFIKKSLIQLVRREK